MSAPVFVTSYVFYLFSFFTWTVLQDKGLFERKQIGKIKSTEHRVCDRFVNLSLILKYGAKH